MPILRFVIVLTLIELFGCSAFEPAHESIESEYPEANESYDVCDLQLDGVKFLSGVWFETTQTCLFSLVAGEVWLPRPIDSSRDYIRVQMQDCDGLSESYRRLETAVLKTSEIVTGRAAPSGPPSRMKDGASFTLWFKSLDSGAGTAITLEGGTGSRGNTPWIDAAFELLAVATACSDI